MAGVFNCVCNQSGAEVLNVPPRVVPFKNDPLARVVFKCDRLLLKNLNLFSLFLFYL